MLVIPSLVRRRVRRSYSYRIVLAAAVLFLLDALYLVGTIPASSHSSSSTSSSSDTTSSEGPAKTTVFIASIHRDSAPRLHATWSEAILSLAGTLGPQNVYFSAVNAHSSDATRAELLQLKERLDAIDVGNSVTHGPTASQLEDEASAKLTDTEPRREGWIRRGDKLVMRRTPLLATLRNQALAPLQSLALEGRTFDAVLWIDDDAVFEPHNVIDLINTRAGDFSAACSVGLDSYLRIRDDSALRDDLGLPPASLHWPWFCSSKSRSAAHSAQPIPVASCWNGLVALDAAPFYTNPPLQFRAIPDSLAEKHIEASERCLLHADNALEKPGKGVWLNPSVRVGYDVHAYEKAGQAQFPSWATALVGSWVNRARRWTGMSTISSSQRQMQARLREWTSEASEEEGLKRRELGAMCLMDDAQIVEPRRPFKFAWEQRK